MENLLKLCLFLLCFETVFTLQCVLCRSYQKGKCVQKGNKTCTTKPGETCMIRRTWGSDGTENLLSAESRCMKSCVISEKSTGFVTTHTFCCDNEDFCNDISFPIVLS